MSALPQKMHVAIVYNRVDEIGTPDERDVLDQVAAVSEAIAKLGHQTLELPCDLNLTALKQKIEEIQPDMVFNLVESLNGHGRLIGVVPCLLDAIGIPYTGAPSGAIHETSHKILSKKRMEAAGLVTPFYLGPWPSESCTKLAVPDKIEWPKGPWIIKSVWEHASLGICGDALVYKDCPEDLMDELDLRAPELGGSCFAERYIDGREFNLSIVAGPDGPVVLPISEIVFENFTENQPRIVCYKAKWDETSFEYIHTSRRFDFPHTDAALLSELRKTALRCWKVFNLRGYARVDFRVDSQNRPWILEVNANPCLSPDAGFSAAVEKAGMTFDQALDHILLDALPQKKFSFTEPFLSPAQATKKPTISDIIFRYEACPQDLQNIRDLVEATGFFQSYEIDVAVELVEDRLTKGAASDYAFVFLEKRGRLAGYACYGPIPCTASSFDLYWIAVHPDFQRQGLGRVINDEVEQLIQMAGGTRIYIETSESSAYDPTRSFYKSLGYLPAAVLDDFYASGDAKGIYCKKLSN